MLFSRLSSPRPQISVTLFGAVLALACAPGKSATPGGSGGSTTTSSRNGGATQVSSPRGGAGGGEGTIPGGGASGSAGNSPSGSTGGLASSTSNNGGGTLGNGSASDGGTRSGGGSSGGAGGNGGTTGTGSPAGGSGGATTPPSTYVNTCTTDSQCPNGHCVSNACVCWDTNAKMCGGACTDVKYNNNSCGDCNKACPATAPRCDYGTCKCDSPPCGGGSGAGGTTSSSGTSGSGGTPATGGTRGSGGVTSSGGSTPTGGSTSGGSQPPPLAGGIDGWASRFWDCCKPSCGWSANASKPMQSCSKDNARLSGYDTQSACSGGSAFMCWDFAPWSVSDTLSYGFAAFNGVPCGTCFQIQFTGATHNGKAESCAPLNGKTMMVQAINIGSIGSGQFDLLIPGGGVGDFNACSNQWGVSDLGATYGGFLSGCNGDKTCVQNKCSTVFSSMPLLKAGCDWFTGWFNAADNPALKYVKVTCPSELSSKSGMSG